METIDVLERRIQTAEDLHSLVRTMKALAAVNIRQLENAVTSLAEYERNVELGLRATLQQQGSRSVTARRAVPTSVGLIVFGSDQGLCGGLNDQLATFTARHLRTLSPAPTSITSLAVGTRVASRLSDEGLTVHSTLATASSISGVTEVARNVLFEIDRWHAERRIGRVMVFHSEHISRAAYELRRIELLPIDRDWLDSLRQEPWPSRSLPMFTMDHDDLFSALISQYLFVTLYRAAAESLASENAARLSAMRGAERTIGDRLVELRMRFHQQRQATITEELLDITSGFEALRDSF